MKRFLNFLSLFGSTATLLCCALPSLFVALGLGGVFASVMGTVPQLAWLSLHKNGVFITAGVLLAMGGWLQWRARFEPCPVDPEQAAACASSRKWSSIVYVASVVVYLIGFFFAYALPRIAS